MFWQQYFLACGQYLNKTNIVFSVELMLSFVSLDICISKILLAHFSCLIVISTNKLAEKNIYNLKCPKCKIFTTLYKFLQANQSQNPKHLAKKGPQKGQESLQQKLASPVSHRQVFLQCLSSRMFLHLFSLQFHLLQGHLVLYLQPEIYSEIGKFIKAIKILENCNRQLHKEEDSVDKNCQFEDSLLFWYIICVFVAFWQVNFIKGVQDTRLAVDLKFNVI